MSQPPLAKQGPVRDGDPRPRRKPLTLASAGGEEQAGIAQNRQPVSVRQILQHRRFFFHLLASAPYGVLRRLSRRRAAGYIEVLSRVRGKSGLELGGPSPFFRANGIIPVYNLCRAIDSGNFSERTIWSAADTFSRYRAPLRSRFIAEASDLSGVPDGAYDFLLASHVLEHVANPLRALHEWARVLTANGVMVVLVPDKRHTSDHRRPYTSFEHLLADYCAEMGEDDLTHVQEVLALHDIGYEHPRESRAAFEARCRDNATVRGIHHHVFNAETLALALRHAGLQVTSVNAERPLHIVAIAVKLATGVA